MQGAHGWIGLMGWFAVCFGAAFVGARNMPGPWYEQLKKPSWTPPNSIFAPVWTVLYAMMAVSAWLVWRGGGGWHGATVALSCFILQLALNTVWSVLFFGMHRPDLAFADICLLWIAILVTIILFLPVSAAAALLLVPYLLWVTFASALNYAVWRLNSPPQ